MLLTALLKKIAELLNRQAVKPANHVAERLEALRAQAAELIAAQPELPLSVRPEEPVSAQQSELLLIYQARGKPQHKTLVQRFVSKNLGLAYDYARRWLCPAIPIEDLKQEAVVALLDAAYRWEPGHGHRFAGFALWRMRAHLQEYVRKKVPIVHLPGNVRADQMKVAKKTAELQRLGRAATPAAIADALSLAIERVEIALAYVGGVKVYGFRDETQDESAV